MTHLFSKKNLFAIILSAAGVATLAAQDYTPPSESRLRQLHASNHLKDLRYLMAEGGTEQYVEDIADDAAFDSFCYKRDIYPRYSPDRGDEFVSFLEGYHDSPEFTYPHGACSSLLVMALGTTDSAATFEAVKQRSLGEDQIGSYLILGAMAGSNPDSRKADYAFDVLKEKLYSESRGIARNAMAGLRLAANKRAEQMLENYIATLE